MDDLSPEEMDRLTEAMGSDVATEKTPEEAAPAAEAAAAAPSTAPQTSGSTAPAGAAMGSSISRAQFMQLEEAAAAAGVPPQELERMQDISVRVEVILGKTRLSLDRILKLQPGSVVELNKLAGEPVEIHVNDKLIARAEVVVIEENFGVKILEIVGTKQKLSALQD